MTSFLLVHGAFRGGWAWSRVRRPLVAAGHDVYAPSLLGAGERAGLVDRVLGLDSWVDELEELVWVEDLVDLVVVAHSQGGIVAAALAARVPERLRAVCYLDAAVPDPGERAVDLGPSGFDLPPRGTLIPPRPLRAAGGLDEETARWASARLTATPMAPSLDPVPAVPRSVVQNFAFCADTPAGYPSQVTRGRLDERGGAYRVLDCDHDAPLVAPALVVDWLIGVE